MDLYIDGKKIGKTVNATVSYEKEKSFSPMSLGMKEVTLTMENVETNLKLLSEKTRLWCKQIKWNGKIYW